MSNTTERGNGSGIASLKRRASAFLFLFTASLLTIAPARVGAVGFNFTYIDPVGQGFNNPTFGPAAQTALEVAGDIWGGYLEESYAGETIDVIRLSPTGTSRSDGTEPRACWLRGVRV